jgi:hypothetical protein
MSSSAETSRSIATYVSWTSVLLAAGGVVCFLVFQVVDEFAPFEKTRIGVLTGFLPRALLSVGYVAAVLAIVLGAGSFLLIRQRDIISKAIPAIVGRSLCGIAVGLCAGVVLWLWVGHIVTGF